MPTLSDDAGADEELMYSPPPVSGWRRWRESGLPFIGRLVGMIILIVLVMAVCCVASWYLGFVHKVGGH
jgi:hypothetical protein